MIQARRFTMELVIALFACGLFHHIGYTQGQKEERSRCSSNAMVLSMSACQASRHKLSLASQTNDTAKLCGALQRYSNCMAPRLEGCKGATRMAFDVIVTKYASHYSCHVIQTSSNHFHGDSPSFVNSYQNQGQAFDPADFKPQEGVTFDMEDTAITNTINTSLGGNHDNNTTTPSNVIIPSDLINTSMGDTSHTHSTTHQRGGEESTTLREVEEDEHKAVQNKTSTPTKVNNAFDPADNNGAKSFPSVSNYILMAVTIGSFVLESFKVLIYLH